MGQAITRTATIAVRLFHGAQWPVGSTVNTPMSPSTTAEFADTFQVRSSDGTPLAVWVGGEGPPIVLVHGSFGDHSAWTIPVGKLNKHFTTFAMDRRGFGASGDGDEYSIERDFDDVAAVVGAVRSRAGEPVALWGHSYGANCAMGGASISPDVHHLVLYEPSLGLSYPPGAIEAAEEALAAGDRETAVVRMLFDVLEMSRQEVEALRSGPRWSHILAGAHTAPRECRAEQAWVYEPGQFGGIDAPTLMLSGSQSPSSVIEATQRAAGAIPNTRIHVLDGHGHFAHRTDPAMVVSIIQDFVSS